MKDTSDGNGDFSFGKFTEAMFNTTAYDAARQEHLDTSGLAYDKNYDRWSLSNGVDLDSAIADWENYGLEREEIATYEAAEERRKEAPDDLTGTGGQVDYSLAIADNDTTTGGTTPKKKNDKAAVDVNVNASTQSLGISQDG